MKAAFLALALRYPGLFPWLRQTSTILGIAGMVGTIAGAMTGEVGWSAAIPALAGSAVAIAMPGHPEAEASVRQAATDAVALSDRTQRVAAAQALLRDGVAARDALTGVSKGA